VAVIVAKSRERTLEFARLGSGAGHRRGRQMKHPDPEDQPLTLTVRSIQRKPQRVFVEWSHREGEWNPSLESGVGVRGRLPLGTKLISSVGFRAAVGVALKGRRRSDGVVVWVRTCAIKPYRGTSHIKKRHPVGPYSRTMPRVPGGS